MIPHRVMQDILKDALAELKEEENRWIFYHYRKGRWIRRYEAWLKQKFIFR